MRISGKILGVSFALATGFLLFLSPNVITGNGIIPGIFSVSSAHAAPSEVSKKYIRRLDAADEAYFKAVRDIKRHGETPSNLARLKAADDAYFETVMAMEAAAKTARQIARIEAADDAYFKAAMLIELMGDSWKERARMEAADNAHFDAVIALESTDRQMTQLAELKAQEQMDSRPLIARADVDDMVTSSLPKNSSAKPDPEAMAEQLQNVKEADDAYFDAVIAIETEGESPERLTALKAADDAYFEAVIAIETLKAEAASAPNVKVASMAPAGGVEKMAKAPAPTMIKHSAPAPRPAVKKYVARSPGYTKHAAPAPEDKPRGPVALLFRVIIKTVGIVPSML